MQPASSLSGEEGCVLLKSAFTLFNIKWPRECVYGLRIPVLKGYPDIGFLVIKSL